jgi:hypothetical protein
MKPDEKAALSSGKSRQRTSHFSCSRLDRATRPHTCDARHDLESVQFEIGTI